MGQKTVIPATGNVDIDSMQLIITIEGKNTVTATNGDTILTAVGTSGTFGFSDMTVGTWTITADNGSNVSTESIEITNVETTLFLAMVHNAIPTFTYTGDYEIVDDADNPITFTKDNWKIRFLTSGTLTFQSLNGATNGIDVFLVGGGGGGAALMNSGTDWLVGAGGGGGYTRTERNIIINADSISYPISIGGSNGNTSGFGFEAAKGGSVGNVWPPNGGSGGGAGGFLHDEYGGNGGSDGNGGGGSNGGTSGGSSGQRTVPGPNGETGNTREFGEEGARLYAGGGGGGHATPGFSSTGMAGGDGGGGHGADSYGQGGSNGEANTGGGGGGSFYGSRGGSGIVIIRNARTLDAA